MSNLTVSISYMVYISNIYICQHTEIFYAPSNIWEKLLPNDNLGMCVINECKPHCSGGRPVEPSSQEFPNDHLMIRLGQQMNQNDNLDDGYH